MKAGKSSAATGVLPSLSASSRVAAKVSSSVAMPRISSTRLHHRHRVHEMHADELARPIGRGGQPGDRDRRGIGGDQRVGLQIRVSFLKISRLISSFSVAASMTMSQSANCA